MQNHHATIEKNNKVCHQRCAIIDFNFFDLLTSIILMGPSGASRAIFVSLAGALRSVVAVGFDDARRGQYY